MMRADFLIKALKAIAEDPAEPVDLMLLDVRPAVDGSFSVHANGSPFPLAVLRTNAASPGMQVTVDLLRKRDAVVIERKWVG